MKKQTPDGVLDSSFRDPSGFVFKKQGIVYRQINENYKKDYNLLLDSNLFNTLVEKGFLVPSTEVKIKPYCPKTAYKIIKPKQLSFISYPYEWSYSQLRDAAILTLNIQEKAIEHGMSLKDASAYNIQFEKGAPLFIDTLSFTKYQEGEPWVAYRQFCKHFFAPLALMRFKDLSYNRFLATYIDGIPLQLASSNLPKRSWLSFSILSHIHLHARTENYYSTKTIQNEKKGKMSRNGLLGIINNLKSAIKSFGDPLEVREWTKYYQETNYSDKSFSKKKNIVQKHVKEINPKLVWDLGANTGLFSRVAAEKSELVVSFDVDPTCVEINYRDCKKGSSSNILPLFQDLTNPSPAIGWGHSERASFLERGPVDLVMALALIHHLAISNNIPLEKLATFLANLCKFLIIEFVPKNDSQVQKLLLTREDIFPNYDVKGFEKAFLKYFTILNKNSISGSHRLIYLMKVK